MFFKARGPPATISLAGCGRKRYQLDARLREMAEALDKLGLNPSSLYHHGAAGGEVPEDNDRYEELRPYRPLDATRVKIKGSGNWDCVEFLSDLLYMPFIEPEINRFTVTPPHGMFPDVREGDTNQTFELCKVWDARNLLRLIPYSLGPAPSELFLHTKVFGNFKSS